MRMRPPVGFIAVCIAVGLYPRLVIAAYDLTVWKEEAKLVCEWIGHRQLPPGVHVPQVCLSPDAASPTDAFYQIGGFWGEWRENDKLGYGAAEDSFNLKWGKRWDPDYLCRSAQTSCRNGTARCNTDREGLIQAGRWCPGVNDIVPFPVAPASMSRQSADPAVDCERLADSRYPSIPDNSQELLTNARDRISRNAVASENLAAAKATATPGGSGDLYVNAMSSAADQQRATQERLLQYDLETNRQQRIERQAEHDSYIARCKADARQ